ADATNGRELWKSNGTPVGTVPVKDILPGSGGSGPLDLTNVNGTLDFSASTTLNARQVWKSDGTNARTKQSRDHNPGGLNDGSSSSALTAVNGTLFFAADDGAHGIELWKSDGTAAGTTLVKDLYPGGHTGYYGGYYIHSSSPRSLTNVNGTLFFSARDASGWEKLWKSDGTEAGTVLVKDIKPGASNSPLGNLTDVNGTLFFSANSATT